MDPNRHPYIPLLTNSSPKRERGEQFNIKLHKTNLTEMDRTPYEQELPGFRFYPTEEELLDFYLKGVLYGKRPTSQVIATVNIYHHDPWELPGLAKIGEREWYFFVPRDKKNTHGGRPNRTTETGFWKATGSDRRIHSMKDPKRVIGMRKTLVFYKGRAPTGCKTDWIMNEYRMPENYPMPKEDIVLCKIYRKATSMKVLEQRAASEEYKGFSQGDVSALMDMVSSPEEQSLQLTASPKEEESNEKGINGKESEATSRQMQMSCVKESLPQLELPTYNLEWMQDPYLFRSPWLENWSPYVNVLNF